MSKSKGGTDNKKWESVGDSILRLVVSEYYQCLPEKIHNMDSISYFSSNNYLCSIRHTVPITFKNRQNNCLPNSKKGKSRVGDEVEYYIAFLYFNYGFDAARRFVYGKISMYIKK